MMQKLLESQQDSIPGIHFLAENFSKLKNYPFLQELVSMLLVLFLGWISYYLFKHYIVRFLNHLLSRFEHPWLAALIDNHPVSHIAKLAPLVIFYYYTGLIDHGLADIFRNFCLVGMLWVAMIILDDLLDTAESIYDKYPISRSKPIKGYIQVAKIILYSLLIISSAAVIIGKSPLYFLSGLGAITAILLLVFKDTILSLVASIQIATNGMIRMGDWISMPSFQADGDIVDIALHHVTIQNWDKTLTTIPTHKFLDTPFKNWKGMSESGGRRICRSIYIDLNSVKLVDKQLISKLSKITLIHDYINRRQSEIDSYNQANNTDMASKVNGRNQTNLGIFRQYLQNYLDAHPNISNDMTKLVRQQAPTEKGVPIQLYIFTNTTVWADYESIQSDIFDHIFATIQEFELRLFQNPTGNDLKELKDVSN
ncbi:MAG: mechanosensitive ion channel family protein [bacterium]|nr:mechanosensitive ion channel family protein [bacterium]